MYTEECLLRHLPKRAMTRVEGLPFERVGSGKVREIFDFDGRLLIFATDRISAFDVILEPGIPGKGVLLTQISLFWFRETEDIVPNHLLPDQEKVLKEEAGLKLPLQLYAMAVRKLKPLPVECVVRGYLAGGGWESYRESGEVCGHKLPAGLRQSQELPSPIFTPTTKETEGHDRPITEAECATILGTGMFEQVREISLALYRRGRERAARAGMILADTKFEFGVDEEGTLFLIDEVLTPDSSRYWPIEGYQPGHSQPSFDKQYVRDYLNRIPWNRRPPAPLLPEDVVRGTRDRYLQAAKQLLFSSGKGSNPQN
ncbi:MAG: phosphoribosylaminoimidazolesuccinocarboxamide synthase [Opitutales bacterium]